MRDFLLLLFFFSSVSIYAQSSPNTDIWVYDLKEKKGKISIKNAQRVTNRAGYDNQPTFYQNDFILYTSEIDGQTDIIVKNLFEGSSMNLTKSAESEYSPQIIGNYDTYGAVRVGKDGKQKLWIFHTDGKTPPEPVLDMIEPVGYFAWNAKNDVIAFVLGEPITLIKGNVNEVDDFLVTSNVGRTLKIIPETDDFAFERNEENGEVVIYRLFDSNDEFKKVITKPENAMDWCITQEGTYITSVGSKLMKFHPEYDTDWVELANLGADGAEGITRMAVNQNNKRLAVVINN